MYAEDAVVEVEEEDGSNPTMEIYGWRAEQQTGQMSSTGSRPGGATVIEGHWKRSVRRPHPPHGGISALDTSIRLAPTDLK